MKNLLLYTGFTELIILLLILHMLTVGHSHHNGGGNEGISKYRM